MADFSISASQLKLFQFCPRSWYLKHILRAPDDQGAGGLYITRGNDFDRLVQRYVRDGLVGDPGAPKLANRQLAAARRSLPATGSDTAVQFAYRVPAGDGFVVVGKPDLRRPGWLGDTKTTSDRGPGVGAAADRPAYALTDATLAEDVQFRLYAWCEFQLNSGLEQVYGVWTYVSKADAPKSWDVRAVAERDATLAWFESYVRPTARKMRELAASGLTADAVGANPEACRRCFVRDACPGPFVGANVYGVTGPIEKREKGMAFDVSKLRRGMTDRTEACAPAPEAEDGQDLTAALAASVEAVAINRPQREEAAPEANIPDPPLLADELAAIAIEPPRSLAARLRELAATADAVSLQARLLAEEVGS